MSSLENNSPLVYTMKNMCKVCYTCVRECPVKAIKIINGQAEVIQERCIACGNCVKVCSQNAKVYHRSGDAVKSILESDRVSVACIAPSFPAEFVEIDDYRELVGMLRSVGFRYVVEVSFGADLVAREYASIFDGEEMEPVITSDCPAVVNYVEKYHPGLVGSLAPVVSPAMAVAEVTRSKYGNDVEVIFIGPCIAKKIESGLFSEVLTFSELRNLFNEKGVGRDGITPSDFDPPHAGKGALFPVNHGLLKTVNRTEGLGKGEVITAEGKSKFMEAIRNFEERILDDQHLELLCCDGCVQGPGMSVKGEPFIKRKRIGEYVTSKLQALDSDIWERQIAGFSGITLNRSFEPADQRIQEPTEEEVEVVLVSMGRTSPSDMLNCGACGYETCLDHAIAVVEGLAEAEMCLPYAIEKLHESVRELNISNTKLARTRQALRQSEKLASMGQVSAGIAHELNNPLGIITLYSSILKDETKKGSALYEDISVIDEQAERCKKIVGGLLNFARKNSVKPEECNIVEFVKHSFKSLIIPKNINLVFKHVLTNPVISLDTDQMMQVLTNLFRNAIEAMNQGGELSVILKQKPGKLEFTISDTGTGISEENIEKIFTPFFTTKKAGKGTGLGLPLAYGIVKMHKGKIEVTSNDNPEKGKTGTTFTITLPNKSDDG